MTALNQSSKDTPSSDLHTHTVFSHGKGTPEENVLAAISRGLKRVAVSEHAAAHVFFGVRGEKLLALRREIDRLASVYSRDIEVLMGYECNLTAFGECDAPEDTSMFDLLLLAYHKGVIPKDGCTRRAALESFRLGHADPVTTANALLAAADKYRIDILAHSCCYVRADIPTLARGASELGILLEINSSHLSMNPAEIAEAASYGARFTANSDAHTPERVGDMAAAVEYARRAGVTLEEWRRR